MKRVYVVALSMLLALSLVACGNATSTEKNPNPSEVEETTEAVRTLSIEAEKTVLYCGERQQLSVSQSPTSEMKVCWKSSDEELAAVDENGNMTAISSGTVSIVAMLEEDPSVCASMEFTVAQHVSSVLLPQMEVALLLGSDKAAMPLDYQVMPENAWCQEVTMTSSDAAVVSVDENGVLHAVAPGMASVTVTSKDDACNESVECVVVVKQGVSSVTLDQEKATFYWGDNIKLNAQVLPENAENTMVTWSSSDETVATVDQNGRVTAVGTGVVEIICTALDGSEVSGKCTLDVVIGVKQLTIDGEKAPLLLGAASELSCVQLACTVVPENATYQNVVWSSSDENVAKVNENGLVQGVAPGKAIITATTTDPRFADKIKATFPVTIGNAVQSIVFADGENRIAKGTSQKLTAELNPDPVFNNKVIWTSSDENILAVSAAGVVRAVGVGKAMITCTAQDGSGVTAQRELTVYQSVTGIQAEGWQTVLFAGQSVVLQAKVAPADATDKSLNWTSDDTSIVIVDSNGKITGKRAGKAVITAMANDGSGKKCTFNIVVEPVVPVTVEKIGFGIYNANLLGVTVKNECTKHSIRNFDFDLELISYDGSQLAASGSYNLGKDVTISAGQTSTIKRTLSGIAWTAKLKITITAVKFNDGTTYSIPWFEQETCTFYR